MAVKRHAEAVAPEQCCLGHTGKQTRRPIYIHCAYIMIFILEPMRPCTVHSCTEPKSGRARPRKVRPKLTRQDNAGDKPHDVSSVLRTIYASFRSQLTAEVRWQV